MCPDAEPARLVERARQGEHYAWEQLLGNLYPKIRAFVGRRVGAWAVEDVVNETMTRSVAGISGFEWGPAGFDGWVFGIARKVVADHYRRTDREQRNLVRSSLVTALAPSADPSDQIDLEEEHLQLRRCFDQLDEGQRELLELRVVAGLSAEQVGAVLGKRAGAVRTAQSRALARLRELMEADSDR